MLTKALIDLTIKSKHLSYIKTKKIGLMKDELDGKIL